VRASDEAESKTVADRKKCGQAKLVVLVATKEHYEIEPPLYRFTGGLLRIDTA
jgi:hypothetical protein